MINIRNKATVYARSLLVVTSSLKLQVYHVLHTFPSLFYCYFPSTSPTYIISSIFTSTIDSSIGNANLCISAVTSVPLFRASFLFALVLFYTSLMSAQYALHQMVLKCSLTHLLQMLAHISNTIAGGFSSSLIYSRFQIRYHRIIEYLKHNIWSTLH